MGKNAMMAHPNEVMANLPVIGGRAPRTGDGVFPPERQAIIDNQRAAIGNFFGSGSSALGIPANPMMIVPTLGMLAGMKYHSDQTEALKRAEDAYNNEYGDSLTPRYDPSRTMAGDMPSNFINFLNAPVNAMLRGRN